MEDTLAAARASMMDLDLPRTPSPPASTSAFLPTDGKNHSPQQSVLAMGNATNISSGSKTVSSMNKRQQAAHRARMTALHRQLKTRLQYAAFKVEHGWSKQSLSEVENLFYKHRRVSGSGHSPNAVASSSSPGAGRSKPTSSSNGVLAPPPTTPTPNWRSSSPHHARKFRTSSGSNSVEAFAGLVTPPASGNTLPTATFDRSAKIATTNTSQRSPSSNNQRKGSIGAGGVAGQPPGYSGRSYADFWSKIGGAVTQGHATNG